ncbi:type II secretion system F family protein [Candidatus Woesearchaeota archaeon]|nr:type II secretion system F family protein [Candidatus Woesearchaeota archaeon]
MKTGFLEQIGKAIIPETFRAGLRVYYSKAGIREVPYKLYGILLYVALIFIGIIYFYSNFYGTINHLSPLLVGLLVFLFWAIGGLFISLIIIGALYFYLNLKIFNRVKEMDINLADYLVLVSTNLKGGLSFEKALWSAIKPEFGVLSEEMGLVSKKVMTGSELSEALKEFSEKYDSPSIRRTIDLILGQVESGGEIASVLDETIETLRKTKVLKEEMAANTLMFTIFIGAIVTVISPLLFALALNLLEILIGVSATVAPALSSSSSTPFSMNEIEINSEDFKIFSVMALTLISIFASLILSIIQKGDIKSGIKYVPLFVFVALTLYFLFLGIFGGLLSFT